MGEEHEEEYCQTTGEWLMMNLLRAVCAATAEILFLRGVRTGALLLGAMLLQPSVLVMGLMGVLAAVAFARVAQLGQTYLERGPFLFNPLLAGLSVGYLFQPSAPALFLAATAGVLAFVLTYTPHSAQIKADLIIMNFKNKSL